MCTSCPGLVLIALLFKINYLSQPQSVRLTVLGHKNLEIGAGALHAQSYAFYKEAAWKLTTHSDSSLLRTVVGS